jgi:hypothetical protein
VRGDDDDGKTMGKLWKDDDDGGGAGDDDDDVEYFYSDPSSPWNSAAMRKKKTAFGGTFSVGKKDNEADFYVTWKTVMKQFFLPEIVSRPV